jgi:hypothetical protein
VRLTDGRTLAEFSEDPPGVAGQPLPPEMAATKFLAAATPVLGAAQAHALADLVPRLGDAEGLAPLLRLLVPPPD